MEKRSKKLLVVGAVVGRLLGEIGPAKVNLTLHVVGRRADGYHLLDSLVVFAGVGDRLTAAPADTLSLTLGGPFGSGLQSDDDNLVIRAAHALRQASGVTAGATLHLEKNLPVASGIGGGSADAAATLRLLTRLWSLTVPDHTLHSIAATLGADVPVCLRSAPRRMGGIGEVLTDAPAIPACGLALVNPGQAVATPDVFRARHGAFSSPSTWPSGWHDAPAFAADLAADRNDLQTPAIALCPAIGEVLAALRQTEGCLLARMSGSGATCFALYETASAAASAAASVARLGWWCWGGALWPEPPGLYASGVGT